MLIRKNPLAMRFYFASGFNYMANLIFNVLIFINRKTNYFPLRLYCLFCRPQNSDCGNLYLKTPKK